jgi:hypothetical protein
MSSVAAHDLDVTGVARLVLDEREPLVQSGDAAPGADYRLSILDTKVPPLYDIARSIPARCESLAPGANSYRFRCQPQLNADDSLLFPWALAGVVLISNWRDGSSHSSYFRGDGAFVETQLAELKAPSAALSRLALQYLALGVEHILFGLDHLLFVLGLMLLLGHRPQPAATDSHFMRYAKTITAFTLAHSLTLGAAVLGWVSVPAAPVESLIALSIVLMAREALESRRGNMSLSTRKPWLVAFGFGLIHGFGFASALGELGLAAGDVPLALLFFNLGVEIGQLGIVAGALIASVLIARMSDPSSMTGPAALLQSRLATAASYGLGGIALFWFIERLPSLGIA